MNTQPTTENGQWCIVEIMGKKVVAGYVTKEEQFGATLLRVDVPATSAYPAFTQMYGNSAIYCVTPVSEQVARMTAEAHKVNPVSVYVPDLETLQRARAEADQLKRTVTELRERLNQARALPEPDPRGFPDGDPDDPDVEEDDLDPLGEDEEDDDDDDF